MAGGEEKEAKQVITDPVLAVACHQAAHAVLGILLGIPFACAEIDPAGGGRLVVDGRPGPAAEEGLACAMAGAAFDALLRPTAPLASIFARSCRCGFCRATWQPEYICFSDGGWKGRKKVIPAFLRSKGLVRANSDAILTVGRMLAVRGSMTYDEILEAATDPADIRERLEEYLARRHWDLCLHEAAHAVMGARDGQGDLVLSQTLGPVDPLPPASGRAAGLEYRRAGPEESHPSPKEFSIL
jgi:hypothetical protein